MLNRDNILKKLILWSLVATFGLALIISYVSIYIDPQKFAIPLFFGLYFIPILFINLLLLIIAIITKSRSAWLLIIITLPTLFFAELFYNFGNNDEPPTSEIELKIESYNVGTFSSSATGEDRDECRAEVVKHIKEVNPDIICFQEFYIDNLSQINRLFPKYKYKHHQFFKLNNGKYFGNLIISRLPIRNKGQVKFGENMKGTNLSIYADVDISGKLVRIYNNHLESYNISITSLSRRTKSVDDILENSVRDDIIDVHEKMLSSFKKRAKQVNMIIEDIQNCPIPTIICGDFNDTPMSFTYHKLKKDHKDSFKESGKGFGASFAPLWPFVRIDYILFQKEFKSSLHNTHKIKLSDHYPVSANIIIQ